MVVSFDRTFGNIIDIADPNIASSYRKKELVFVTELLSSAFSFSCCHG